MPVLLFSLLLLLSHSLSLYLILSLSLSLSLSQYITRNFSLLKTIIRDTGCPKEQTSKSLSLMG